MWIYLWYKSNEILPWAYSEIPSSLRAAIYDLDCFTINIKSKGAGKMDFTTYCEAHDRFERMFFKLSKLVALALRPATENEWMTLAKNPDGHEMSQGCHNTRWGHPGHSAQEQRTLNQDRNICKSKVHRSSEIRSGQFAKLVESAQAQYPHEPGCFSSWDTAK
jgi:hypothetical protein